MAILIVEQNAKKSMNIRRGYVLNQAAIDLKAEESIFLMILKSENYTSVSLVRSFNGLGSWLSSWFRRNFRLIQLLWITGHVQHLITVAPGWG
jgi:hypothetical protein